MTKEKMEKYKQTEKNKTIEDFKRVIANYFSYSSYDLFYSDLINTGIKGTIQNTFADMINLMEKLKKENQELRNTKNNCPQFNTSGIKCKNKDIHCPTSKETSDYYENFLIPGYEEEIKKLQKENGELKEKNDNNNVYKDLQEDLTSLLKKEFIPKDKIKELFAKHNINISEDEITVDGYNDLYFIDELKELLEEE